MAFDFPATPSVGQVFGNYIWDGEKWKLQGGQALGAVRYDTAQILSAGQQTQARHNIAAPDLAALGWSGMQINGSMEVSQESGAAGRTTPGYVRDGWQLYFNGTMVIGSGPSGAVIPGISNGIYINVGTAQASLSGANTVTIYQTIEGYRLARLAWGKAEAQPITIAFWSKHHRTGIYSCVVRSSTRSYAATYTHNVADVTQYNVITIPGDTTGTWAVDNTGGMTILFSNGTSATSSAPSANTWVAGLFDAAPGQVNGVASTSDIFVLTGVVVLPGTQAPTAAQSPLIMRPFDQELVTCKRYWQKLGGTVNVDALVAGYAVAGGSIGQTVTLPVEMRALPTGTVVGTWWVSNCSQPVFSSAPGTKTAAIQATVTATGNAFFYTQGVSSLVFDARL